MVKARIVGVSWLRRTLSRIRDRIHLWSGCECHVINTPEGIGGQCIWCGRIYGWMTSEELRRPMTADHRRERV